MLSPSLARVSFVSLALFLASATPTATSAGTWTAVATDAPAVNAGVAILLSDGTVLVLGDAVENDGIGDVWHRLTPDATGSYVNGTWTGVAPMGKTREYFSSQVLMDGRLYVAGGEYGTGKSKAEVYNPVLNTWTPTPFPGGVVSDANSEMLPDGRVLQALVEGNLRKTRIYDPVSNTFVDGPQCVGIHNESVWMKLPDDSVLFVDRGSTASERYRPGANAWKPDATVPVELYDPWGLETGAALLLPDGRAFFLGSPNTSAYYQPSGTSAPGTWKAGPAPPSGSGAPDAPMAMLVNGSILCALSPAPTPADHFPKPTTFYEFDYQTNVYQAIAAPGGGGSIDDPSYTFCFLALPDGSVFCTHQASATYYVYTPQGRPLAAGRPAITSVVEQPDSTYLLTGTGFNGISQGASYGDDWQMNTNYPIVRLASTSGPDVFYSRTYGWNSTGVATGRATTTTSMALPSSIASGSYTLVVVANGIASDPVAFHVGSGPCAADLDADGTVGAADLSVLLGQWNTVGEADLDASGVVDAADLAQLLAGWGRCP